MIPKKFYGYRFHRFHPRTHQIYMLFKTVVVYFSCGFPWLPRIATTPGSSRPGFHWTPGAEPQTSSVESLDVSDRDLCQILGRPLGIQWTGRNSISGPHWWGTEEEKGKKISNMFLPWCHESCRPIFIPHYLEHPCRYGITYEGWSFGPRSTLVTPSSPLRPRVPTNAICAACTVRARSESDWWKPCRGNAKTWRHDRCRKPIPQKRSDR